MKFLSILPVANKRFLSSKTSSLVIGTPGLQCKSVKSYYSEGYPGFSGTLRMLTLLQWK